MGDIADEHAARYYEECGDLPSFSRYAGRSHSRVTRVPYIRVLRETEKAYLLLFEEGESIFEPNKEAWLPKSHCKLDTGASEAFVSEKLAIEKGLV